MIIELKPAVESIKVAINTDPCEDSLREMLNHLGPEFSGSVDKDNDGNSNGQIRIHGPSNTYFLQIGDGIALLPPKEDSQGHLTIRHLIIKKNAIGNFWVETK